METFLDYLILALSGLMGIGGHLFAKFRDAHTKQAPMDWKTHTINSLFAVFVITVLLLFADELESIYPLTKFSVFIAGYMADSVWKNITKFTGDKLKV